MAAERVAFKVIVPARMRSTRLPGKMLADIHGKPLVAWVAERAAASGAEEVVVATDHADIAQALSARGCKVISTSPDHPTGTDRLAEAVDKLGLRDDEIVVNVQGDEPLIDPALVRAVAAELAASADASIATAAHPIDDAIVVNVQGDEPLLEPALMREVAGTLSSHADASIATACHPIQDAAEAFNPNVVKVVLDRHGYALYFSRATIPWARDAFADGARAVPPELPLYRHYGLYAYRVGFLRQYPTLAPAPIERFEALEQLRALWYGYRIIVRVTRGAPAPGVDTAEDLERVRGLYAQHRV